MDFNFLYNNHNIPSNFNNYYLDYITNPLLWLMPFDKNKELLNKELNDNLITKFINNITNITIINDYLLYNKNDIKLIMNNEIYYYLNILMFNNKNNNLLLEDIFDKYYIYYNINNNKCHNLKINELSILGKFIQIIIEYVLNNDNIMDLINNSSIEHYYNYIYDKSINLFKKENNILTNNIYELFNKNIQYNTLIYPPTKITDKLYCNNLKKYFNYDFIVFLPIYYKKIFDNDFDINNYYNEIDIKNNINKFNNYIKLSKIKNLKFNKINNIDLNDLNLLKEYVNQYNKLKLINNKTEEESFNYISLIGNIDCLLNHKNFVY